MTNLLTLKALKRAFALLIIGSLALVASNAASTQANAAMAFKYSIALIGDMPYMTYQPSVETAIRCAGRFMAEAACDSVKLEGGIEMADRVAGIVRSGIPCMGHLGLTPQSIYKFGTYEVRAKKGDEAERLLEDASLLEQYGCFALVLEKIPAALATKVAKSISIPVIGIGAGPHLRGAAGRLSLCKRCQGGLQAAWP